jgi:hypothetical protein
MALLGWLLVVLGVAREGIAEGFVSTSDVTLQKFNQLLLTETQREASFAVERASVNERVAAQLSNDAEEERAARIHVEESVEWRRLSKGQQAHISANLKDFSGQLAELLYNTSDVEANEFASTIQGALRSAGWNVRPPRPITIFLSANPGVIETGVAISGDDDASVKAANALVRELTKSGFDSIPGYTPQPSGSPSMRRVTVVIFVKYRPEGPQGEAKLREQAKHRK